MSVTRVLTFSTVIVFTVGFLRLIVVVGPLRTTKGGREMEIDK